MRLSLVVQQIEDTVTAYMQGKRSFCEAQSAIENRLPCLIDGIAQAMGDEWGAGPTAGPTKDSIDERMRRKRSVYAQVIIRANGSTRDDGRSLQTNEIEKLLRLVCWISDTVEELEQHRSLPAASAAA